MNEHQEKDSLDDLDTSIFFQMLTDCFVPSQKAQSVELVHTASIAILSTLFTSARILDNDGKPKSMNLFLGVVGPPASGKSMALAPRPLIYGVEDYVRKSLTTAGISPGMPDKTVKIPGDILKTRINDHLWVNNQTDTPTLFLESESSTIVNALLSQHGGFRDVLNKFAENEPIGYSRVSGGGPNGRTVNIDYPMATMVLTGTYDQAVRMYELPSGTFSRFLYFTLTGTEEFQPLKKYDGPGKVNSECREFLANRVLELYQFYRGQGILVDPNQEVLDAYNAFAASRHTEGKALLKSDASFIYRYVFRILKIAGIYALLRTWLQSGKEKYNGEGVVEISMDDFNSAMIHEPTLWDSHLAVYGLVKGKVTNPHAAIVNALSSTFTTADFKTEYQKQRATLPDNRSITRYLKSLIQDQLIERTQKGTFLKL
jgi:hypothetical protein